MNNLKNVAYVLFFKCQATKIKLFRHTMEQKKLYMITFNYQKFSTMYFKVRLKTLSQKNNCFVCVHVTRLSARRPSHPQCASRHYAHMATTALRIFVILFPQLSTLIVLFVLTSQRVCVTQISLIELIKAESELQISRPTLLFPLLPGCLSIRFTFLNQINRSLLWKTIGTFVF